MGWISLRADEVCEGNDVHDQHAAAVDLALTPQSFALSRSPEANARTTRSRSPRWRRRRERSSRRWRERRRQTPIAALLPHARHRPHYERECALSLGPLRSFAARWRDRSSPPWPRRATGATALCSLSSWLSLFLRLQGRSLSETCIAGDFIMLSISMNGSYLIHYTMIMVAFVAKKRPQLCYI